MMTTQTINLKLIESLIQAIDALSLAEQNIVRSRLLNSTPLETPRESAIDILNSSPGQQIFKTPEEVDRYIQEERASWDS
jgi:hypothetical protein